MYIFLVRGIICNFVCFIKMLEKLSIKEVIDFPEFLSLMTYLRITNIITNTNRKSTEHRAFT